MRKIYAYSYEDFPFPIDKLEYSTDPGFEQTIITIQNQQAELGIYEYISDLDEYRGTFVKKLYVKGGSKKRVPKQVLNIETQSFITRPGKFLDKYDIEFEEF